MWFKTQVIILIFCIQLKVCIWLTKVVYAYKWIRTLDFWCRKQLLCQLLHNRCCLSIKGLKTEQFFSTFQTSDHISPFSTFPESLFSTASANHRLGLTDDVSLNGQPIPANIRPKAATATDEKAENFRLRSPHQMRTSFDVATLRHSSLSLSSLKKTDEDNDEDDNGSRLTEPEAASSLPRPESRKPETLVA